MGVYYFWLRKHRKIRHQKNYSTQNAKYTETQLDAFTMLNSNLQLKRDFSELLLITLLVNCALAAENTVGCWQSPKQCWKQVRDIWFCLNLIEPVGCMYNFHCRFLHCNKYVVELGKSQRLGDWNSHMVEQLLCKEKSGPALFIDLLVFCFWKEVVSRSLKGLMVYPSRKSQKV